MANKRANPLSGSFKSPPSIEGGKENTKTKLETKAGILGNNGKPPEPPKAKEKQKASGTDGPVKPAEEKKPPEPPNVEWASINGKEFYQLITSPAGMGRYFIDMDEFMIESIEAEYKDWRKERDHSDYLHEQESQIQFLPLYGSEDDSQGDLIPDIAASTEETALHSLELQELTKAGVSGFSPRNLRRMREFYHAYENAPEVVAQAMTIGWTQNTVILEAELTLQEWAWYIQAAHQFGWSKLELQRKIATNAHLDNALDFADKVCYTAEKNIGMECTTDEKNPLRVPRQYLEESRKSR